MHQYCPRQAPPSHQPALLPANCHVLAYDDYLYLHPLRLGTLRGQTKVQAIARIVLNDHQGAVRGADGTKCGQDLARRGRGEDLPGHGGGEHRGANKGGMGGFVAGTA
ncbi:hypothetical protein BC938DRAFT_479754 [Jimgerdemannia flammicorona]|uniref:Uncharacterized protein n=1 Tax=Jimgerdemannia flammicorona TaxID=994334 RepID=A0A433QXL5_9FUNG|nr:hypothetical protein BC938DRAFT_479754 [Jimgerdemannia flammicorona]